MSLTIAYITSRKEPKLEWFLDSFERQSDGERVNLIVVRGPDKREPRQFQDSGPGRGCFASVLFTSPKPTVWQGPHRLTSCDWWAKSNALNTAIILCRTDWIAFVDDRSLLGPHWMEAVQEAMAGNYAVCGAYEKWSGLFVQDGRQQIVEGGDSFLLGKDHRMPGIYEFDSWYGGSGALPLEWCLAVNGYDEPLCDSAGTEDSMFGVTLLNSGFPIKYDSRMLLIEDRTPGQIDGALKRADKNPHLGQQAKSWAIVRAFHGRTTSTNEFDIRNMRDRVLLNGEDLNSIPPTGSDRDWYDGQLLAEME